MTRSIFDPTGGESDRSGSTFTPQQADNISHMPPDVVDGEAGEQEAAEAQAAEQPAPGPANAAPAPGEPDVADEYDH